MTILPFRELLWDLFQVLGFGEFGGKVSFSIKEDVKKMKQKKERTENHQE